MCRALFRSFGSGIRSMVGRYFRAMFDTGFAQDPTLESDLECLSDWQRRHLPNIHSPLGQQILAWLIRNRDQAKPFSHLLVSTSSSRTSVRHLLNQFAVVGLVEIRKSAGYLSSGGYRRHAEAAGKTRGVRRTHKASHFASTEPIAVSQRRRVRATGICVALDR